MNGIKWGRIDLPANKIKNVIIICSGPSVNLINLKLLEQFRRSEDTYIIAVNGAGNFIKSADAWFTLDPWGLTTEQLPTNFKGKLFAAVPDDYGTERASSAAHRVVANTNITYLHRLISNNYTNVSSDYAFRLGLSDDNSCISSGNSGYGAVNLAYHMKPERIFLLGVDGSIGYFYKSNKPNRALTHLPTMFNSIKQQLIDANISVFNVSETSKINAFPKIKPDEFYKMLGIHEPQ